MKKTDYGPRRSFPDAGRERCGRRFESNGHASVVEWPRRSRQTDLSPRLSLNAEIGAQVWRVAIVDACKLRAPGEDVIFARHVNFPTLPRLRLEHRPLLRDGYLICVVGLQDFVSFGQVVQIS